MDEKEDKTTYKVVVNHEEQYSIWPADRENARALSARFVGQHAAILVVRVRGNHDQAGAGVELFQALPKRGGALVDRDLAVVNRGPD